jgi:hypothetical protein
MPTMKRIIAALAAIAAVLLAGCAANQLVAHQSNPAHVGKAPKKVMVYAIAYDATLRRVFEDRMVERLGSRGIQGVPAYTIITSDSPADEAQLRAAVAKSGADAVMISRPGAEEQSTTIVSGGTVYTGTVVGLYGYYSGVWQVTKVAPREVEGATWVMSSTRLFDVGTEAAVWSGTVKTSMQGDMGPTLNKYVDLVFKAMVADKVI